MGCVALCQQPPGKSQTFGLSRRQCSRRASSKTGLSMTSRSLRPLPPRIWTIMRWLSMSWTLESCGLGTTRARSVESHQQDAVEGGGSGVNQLGDFLLAENRGQPAHLFGVGCLLDTPAPLEGLDEKEAQGGQLLGHTAGIQFSDPEQIRLVFTDVLGAQPVRRAMEVAGEISDGT